MKPGSVLVFDHAIFHGASDPVFSVLDTVDWVDTLTANDPEADEFMRFYIVPGMPHGPGGIAPDRFDMLTALVGWVEEGTAPGPIDATLRPDRDGMPEDLAGQTRPLCPYPQIAQAQDDSFACAVP